MEEICDKSKKEKERKEGERQRNSMTSYFKTVPKNRKNDELRRLRGGNL